VFRLSLFGADAFVAAQPALTLFAVAEASRGGLAMQALILRDFCVKHFFD
jgi:hypothetical protein